VSAIQIKNIPDDLHEQLRERARKQGQSLSDYVRKLIELDLALPTTEEWLERIRRRDPVTDVGPGEIAALIAEGRRKRDEQIRSAITHH
jgi:antitoxin FitA